MEKKEKVKDFNQRFTTILNKFPDDIPPHNSITIDHYTKALPQDIIMFVKREASVELCERYHA